MKGILYIHLFFVTIIVNISMDGLNLNTTVCLVQYSMYRFPLNLYTKSSRFSVVKSFGLFYDYECQEWNNFKFIYEKYIIY